MKTLFLAALLAASFAAPVIAQTPATENDDDDKPAAAAPIAHYDYGPAGIMAKSNREDLAPLTLAVGKPVAEGEYDLKSGGYYRIKIVADGSGELGLSGGDFFRSVWINEMVINSIEIRPTGVHSVEFDKAGEITMTFIAITPGRYVLGIPGAKGESQQAVFNIR